ncbi:MAG TPA: hypothetical protein DD656_02615 [Alphaproteobacteria bacterium]|nr:hypothetical protein [Alphaproteobacteria bacterium]HCJ61232.1 hypothetical protein [Alphaproteobacteria bacterium]|tara:strand:+ start:188 stop:370 length:183 start_codon:yes stop_codon:yes gene_type:complete
MLVQALFMKNNAAFSVILLVGLLLVSGCANNTDMRVTEPANNQNGGYGGDDDGGDDGGGY